ncbi:MAG: ATP-binding protein, partial [Acidobacteriia bacterium]|nr:ATP-binding protein [Terriglobia bacterium]
MATATKIEQQISPTLVFPGPRAFKVEEAGFFCGREREAAQLTDLLITYQDVLLYAQSGSGKTSLINARLLPQLGIEDCYLARVGGELLAGMKLEDIPDIFIYNLIASIVKEPGNMPAISANMLEQFFRSRLDRENVFLIIDQAEEIFTTYQERWGDRRDFFE